MEKYIHRENLALFKKRLAEAHNDVEREVLLKLAADEEAKEPLLKISILKPRLSAQQTAPALAVLVDALRYRGSGR
jgi:hypothetical protein